MCVYCSFLFSNKVSSNKHCDVTNKYGSQRYVCDGSDSKWEKTECQSLCKHTANAGKVLNNTLYTFPHDCPTHSVLNRLVLPLASSANWLASDGSLSVSSHLRLFLQSCPVACDLCHPQVLEDVCKKHGFNPENHGLKSAAFPHQKDEQRVLTVERLTDKDIAICNTIIMCMTRRFFFYYNSFCYLTLKRQFCLVVCTVVPWYMVPSDT